MDIGKISNIVQTIFRGTLMQSVSLESKVWVERFSVTKWNYIDQFFFCSQRSVQAKRRGRKFWVNASKLSWIQHEIMTSLTSSHSFCIWIDL